MQKTYLPSIILLLILFTLTSLISVVDMSQAQEEKTQQEETVEDSTTSDEIIELDKILITGERVYSTASSR